MSRIRTNAPIQSLRGLAVILMVAGHVIGSASNRGLEVADDSLWRLSYVGLEDLRMPLFTAISGFVFALRPRVVAAGYPALIRGKVRRLLVPLGTVGTVLFATQLVVPGVNSRPDGSDWWRTYVFGFEHLWFLQAIFLIFAVVGAAEIAGVSRTFAGWAAFFGVACLLNVVVQVPAADDVFSLNGALQLLPFFLLGMGFHRFADRLDLRRRLWLSVPVFAVAYGFRMSFVLADVDLAGPASRGLSLVVGLSGLVTVFLLRTVIANRALAWLGAYSFSVYLLHVFAEAGARLALTWLGVDSDALLFVLCLAVGIALPVLFERTFGRWSVVSWGVLGQKPRRRLEPAPPAPVAAAR